MDPVVVPANSTFLEKVLSAIMEHREGIIPYIHYDSC